ncbi:MAG: glycosyltransferase family 4 protein, partial [Terriglobales bacterium]
MVHAEERPASRPLRILLLSQFYSPEPLYKMPSLAQELARRGHTVTVLTGFPNYPTGKLYPGYRVSMLASEEQEGVRVLRVPLYPDHSRSTVLRSANYLSFAASATLLGPVFAPSTDLIWTCPPMTVGIPAWWLGLLAHVPFVYEVQDMWPETVAATAMLSNGLALGVLASLARFVYRRAAAVTVVSPGFRENLIAKGVPPHKVHLIPNWADDDLYHPLSPDLKLAEEFGLNGRFNVMFAGNLGAAQGLEHVLAAAARLRDLPEIQFVIVGSGLAEPALRAQAEAEGLASVRFLGQHPATRMVHFLALADVLLVHLRRDPLFDITIPSKTLAYLACGRPILSATSGDAADVVREAGAGLVCPPEDAEALAQA